MEYSLRLISCNKPESPSNIFSSNQMIGWGLWRNLCNYPHIQLSYYNSVCGERDNWESFDKEESVDFTLIHSYAPFTGIPKIKARTKYQVMWISELAYPGMDYNFTFLPDSSVITEQIHLPILDELIPFTESKIAGKILLDHNIPHNLDWHPFYANWSNRLFEWFEPMIDHYKIYQQRRIEWESPIDGAPPEWVNPIPLLSYPEYLKTISTFETFIMTHPGTYEHQIIDLVSQGIRVLIPIDNNRPFAPQDTIDRLKLETFTTKDELMALLNSPLNKPQFHFESCTPMNEVASRINVHCQKTMRTACQTS